MDSDKNNKDLGELLKILHQPIRRDILKALKSSENPLSYSLLQKEVLKNNPNSVNFSFHIKPLKKFSLISYNELGYTITDLGKKLFEFIENVANIINTTTNNELLVRTSKYSKEKFDIKKIEEYLIKEGELETHLAKKITEEVKQRLNYAKIKYLTAPLIREYINAILLENGLEDVRHKLTRLGTPPFEVFKLFNSKENTSLNPEKFINRLGSDVSEQFLLLNLLPKDIADLYLSGEITLLYLNYWALRPLSLYIDMKTILNFIYKKCNADYKNLNNHRNLAKIILKLIDLLQLIKPFFSDDILLGNFNKYFLSIFNFLNNDKRLLYFNLLISQILKCNKIVGNNKSYISLEYSYNNPHESNENTLRQLKSDFLFLKKLNKKTDLNLDHIRPTIMINYSYIKPSEIDFNYVKDNIVFYNGKNSNLINSSIVKVKESKNPDISENKVIMDKILINLYAIALESNQNDNKFFEILETKLNSIFELFKYKQLFVKKKLDHIKMWRYLISELIGNYDQVFNEYAIRSVSFYGLNEAVKTHCGIELDKLDKSEQFGIRIISLLNKLIKERNTTTNECYILSQPLNEFLKNVSYNGSGLMNAEFYHNASDIIRKDSRLPLHKQISLFKKFERYLDGGSIFKCGPFSKLESQENYADILFESELNAFIY